MFDKFKKAMQQHFAGMINSTQVLYFTDIDKDKMWNTYLNSFPEDTRQEYNCNCCKQFIRNYGNLVAIVDNRISSIWSFACDQPFWAVVTTMNDLVRSRPVRDIFVPEFAKLGTNSNVQKLEEIIGGKSTVTWQHLFFELPKSMVHKSSQSVAERMGVLRSTYDVFKRSLETISTDAIETVLELIGQNSLYRGAEFRAMLEEFLDVKRQYMIVNGVAERDNFCWSNMSRYSGSVARIRNTSIGTLLIDISEGKDLDIAVSAFERIMAPANYKRPNALITKGMIEQAEKTIKELGYENSLGRRFAVSDDITVSNVLFVNRDAVTANKGILAAIEESLPVNMKSLECMEKVTIDAFIKNILPKATNVEILFENRHAGNLMSLITAKNLLAPSLFKWPNPFSWSYRNALTDSMKERVKEAGGNVDGVLRYSIQWNEDGQSVCDLDAHATEPNRTHISYNSGFRKDRGNVRTGMSGQLDVDMISPQTVGVENITWTDRSKMKDGEYLLSIVNFNEGPNTGFQAEVEFDGEIHSFNYNKRLIGKINVARVTLNKGVFTIKPELPSNTTGAKSKTIWNIDTNKFHKVNMVMQSPNFWDGKTIGNAHTFFIIDNAHNDEQVRGFFNEFLKPELDKHKRVFEALGSKMQVEPADKQVTGLGFSVTNHDTIIVKVDGAFSRTLKIKF